ncbi:sugar ABC transporter substrate-binding protein [Clostridium cylindrosporum]|uniref:ABC-type sugar transport system, periplasmic component n=1 Tax=Clostridium cylindrosporum DSM 605 TaxID=1121307 RepID=A0A0J8DEA8_CLOCY|nr:sugar ABC transporter substrate-binding protein [Clostridium cylindrosporum]KMT22559.1 ABC-type sugar transport system, periplasmic component [Clostridium cylindrosporum DSM 605]
MKKLLSLFLILVVVLGGSLVGCKQQEKETASNTSSTTDKVEKNENVDIPVTLKDKEVKIAVIRKIGGDDHTAQFLAGAKKEGERLGVIVNTFSANGDTTKFHDSIAQAIEKDYDGYIISHGDDKGTVDYVKKIRDKGKAVVTFDSNPEISKIDGVTLTSQDDESLALLSFKKLIQDHNGKANIAYLWVDGFPPMVNRNRIYEDLKEKYPDIKEVERWGVAAADTSVQTQNAVSAILSKYPKGKLDAIYATWDAFAIGATRAVKEAGRSEVKIYGIDVSNADLQAISEEGSPWISTAAVDPKLVGAVNLRIVMKKLAGEMTPKFYDLEASLINKDSLTGSKNVNMENLSQFIKGFGVSSAFDEPWMNKLKEENKK